MNESSSELQNSIAQRKKEFLKEKLLPEERSFFYSQYNRILKQIADKVSSFSIKTNENEDDFENRLYDAVEIVDDLRHAISGQNQPEVEEEVEDKDLEEKQIKKQDHDVWFHGNIQGAFYQGFESEHSKKVDKDWLTEQAIKYLHRPWMENELLEWILVDSLMFGEVTGFGEGIKQYSSEDRFNLNQNYYSAKGNIEKMKKKILKENFENLGAKFVVFFIFPLLIAFFSYHIFSKDWAVLGSVAYFSLLIFFFFIRGAFRLLTRKGKNQEKAINKSMELFDSMSGAYDILKDGTISPKYLREKLYETSQLGAVWPSAVFMIVDHAVKRNPAIWNSPASLEYENY